MTVVEFAVEQLAEATDALAALDPDTLTDGELHELVVAVQRQRARLGAATAGLLARWDSRRGWADDGSRTPAARLARETNTAVASAKVELRRARQLASMPATAAAVAGGSLSLDHVDLLARANRPWRHAVFAEHEAMLVVQCATLRFAEAVRLVEYWCQRADAAAADDDAARCRESARLHASTTIDGRVVLNGEFDPAGGAAVVGELDRLEREQSLADERDGVMRTVGQRRAAALVEMARRSAAAAGGRKPKPLFTVVFGHRSFEHLCELGNGQVIAPGLVLPWLGDADLETILFDGPSTVISVSKKRTFTGALRRAIQVRDRRCQHPAGCDQPADGCDVDHIVPAREGGVTSQFNAKIECPPHNRIADKHDHGGIPQPERPVTWLDELRARLRWRYLHQDDPDDPDTDAA